MWFPSHVLEASHSLPACHSLPAPFGLSFFWLSPLCFFEIDLKIVGGTTKNHQEDEHLHNLFSHASWHPATTTYSKIAFHNMYIIRSADKKVGASSFLWKLHAQAGYVGADSRWFCLHTGLKGNGLGFYA